MHNFWVVVKNEYRKHVTSPAFLITTIGLPLLIVGFLAAFILIAIRSGVEKPLGYVDQSGLFRGEGVQIPGVGKPDIEIREYSDETAARKALESGQIVADYLIPADYVQTRKASLYYWDKPPAEQVQGDFRLYMRTHLAAGLPTEAQARLIEGANVVIRAIDGSREFGESTLINVAVPFIAGMIFMFAVLNSAGKLLQVVTDEKENRTMEILMTSLTPGQFIGGKALGLILVSLTQLSLYLALIVAGILIGAHYWQPLQAAKIPWDFILLVFLFFLPAFTLVGGVMTAIGGIASELSQGQQIAGLINLLFIFPFFVIAVLITNPNSPILVVLTLFPTTSFLMIALRWCLVVVPFWQIAAAWVLLVASGLFSVWASARIFRLGMLSYGQRLTMDMVMGALKG